MSDTITLKALCEELKVDPKSARKQLRLALRKPQKFPELFKSHKRRGSWQWQARSNAGKEARLVVESISQRS